MSDKKSVEVGVKLYLNGFPKSGTHALNSMGALLLPQLTMRNWLGNLDSHAFVSRIGRQENQVVKALDEFLPGRFIKGHMAHTPKIAEAFQRNHICKAFIFRDFRDVAVSATYHALGHKDNHFPNIEFYQTLEFDEVLKRIITGDENIDGVMDRWETFAPWLDEDWVLKIVYEDLIEHKYDIASLFVRYVYGKAGKYLGVNVNLDPQDFSRTVSRLVGSLEHPEGSVTFRKGKAGGWRKHFTDEHKALFKASDTNNWLIKLGYENDRNW